ncbi:MAG: hypothetical protein IT172_04185 [Acidobacteria bacterium]|nr:hypothetical protein [Acidobacteriota bacterium]
MSKKISDKCPRCGKYALKRWKDLDRDELIAAESLTAKNASVKRLAVCTACWFLIGRGDGDKV